MHRVKKLEFEHILIVSANPDVVPLARAMKDDDDPVSSRATEVGERALLYVALARAKESARVFAYGTLSPYLLSR